MENQLEMRQKESKLCDDIYNTIMGWSGLLALTTAGPAISMGCENNNNSLLYYGTLVSITALVSITYAVGKDLLKKAHQEARESGITTESLRLLR